MLAAAPSISQNDHPGPWKVQDRFHGLGFGPCGHGFFCWALGPTVDILLVNI